jgi:hypothetical protein
MAKQHFMAFLAAPERKAVPSVKAQPRPRTAKMDAFMAKVHANPRYEVENVAASMSAALDAARARAKGHVA